MSIANLFTNDLKNYQNLDVNTIDCEEINAGIASINNMEVLADLSLSGIVQDTSASLKYLVLDNLDLVKFNDPNITPTATYDDLFVDNIYEKTPAHNIIINNVVDMTSKDIINTNKVIDATNNIEINASGNMDFTTGGFLRVVITDAFTNFLEPIKVNQITPFDGGSPMLISHNSGGGVLDLNAVSTVNLQTGLIDRVAVSTASTDISNLLKVNDIKNLIVGDMSITNTSGDILIEAVGAGEVKIENTVLDSETIKINEVRERTPANSVSFIDDLKTNNIFERTGNTGCTIDGLLIKDSAIQFSSPFDTYIEDTQANTFSGPYASPIAVTLKFTKIGNVITMSWRNVLSTATIVSSILLDINLPVAYRPVQAVNGVGRYIRGRDNGTITLTEIFIESTGLTRIWLGVTSGNFTGAGSTGIFSGSITYS